MYVCFFPHPSFSLMRANQSCQLLFALHHVSLACCPHVGSVCVIRPLGLNVALSIIIWGYTAFQLSIAFTGSCPVSARGREGWCRVLLASARLARPGNLTKEIYDNIIIVNFLKVPKGDLKPPPPKPAFSVWLRNNVHRAP